MNISTVFFDLGSTLLYARDPWSPIFFEADKALVFALEKMDISIPYEEFKAEYGGFLNAYYLQRGIGVIEKTASVALKELLATRGRNDVPVTAIRQALDAMYAVTQKNWYLEDDAIPALKELRKRGLRLGIISNTSDDKNAQQLIDVHNLRSYFESIVTSAGCGIRKPDGRIFDIALNNLQVSPQEAVMIGDTLEADILGANLKGIYSVWITRRVKMIEEGELTIQPQAVISNLSQIPPLMTEIEEEN